MNKTIPVILLMVLLVLGIRSSCHAGDKDTLVVYLGTQPFQTLDPAHLNIRPILVLYHNWGDTLVYRDPVRKTLVPCLAEWWQALDEHTLEFKLRKGVCFHNGEPFTAEAARFSLALLKGPDSQVAVNLAGLEGVEVVDEHTVRIRHSIPCPLALEVIANVLFVYPPVYYGKAGKEGFGRHPVGTGPYRFASRDTPSTVLFAANSSYFGGPKGKARIPYLKVVTDPEEILHMEALISGETDLLRSSDFHQEQVAFLKNIASLKIKSTPILRVCFMTMDATGRSGVEFFKDKRVRMAVNHAIHKERLIERAYNGYGDRTDTMAGPFHFGYEPDVTRYPYDPAEARRLLREAGYPEGFAVDFFVGVNESAGEAIARDLKAVGIRTRLHWMGGKWASFYWKLTNGEVPLAFLSWGSYSIFDASAILDPFFLEGEGGCCGTTPELTALLQEARCAVHNERRKSLLSEAQKIIAAEALCVPIRIARAVCVMKRGLNFEPSFDEIDRYFTASWE